MKISAIVPVHNSADFIADTLESLLNQTKPFDEIIVVDDASTDNSREIIKKFKGIKLIELKKRSERSKARNIGAKKAKGGLVAFVESDSSYSREWVREVLDCFEKGFDAVIDRRKVHNPYTFVAKMNDSLFELRYKKYVPFSAWVFKKTVFEEAGGFDEKLMCGEDRELGTRLLKKGFKIGFARKAIQYHRGEPTSLRHEAMRSFCFGKSMFPYYIKVKEMPFVRLAIFPISLILLLGYPFLFAVFILLFYFLIFLKSIVKGIRFKYACLIPIVSIIQTIFFDLGFYYSLLKGN